MPASYDTSGDMVFTSCDTIIKNFVFLAQVVEKLDDSYFELFTVPQIRERKKLIIQDLALDTAFKLLTKLEAKIKQDYNAAIARKRKDELSKRYMSLCKKFRGRIQGYNEPLEKICKEVALDDILDEIKLSF
jgi:hypothetical protein